MRIKSTRYGLGIASAFALSSSFSEGAQYIVSNGNGADASGIADSSGAVFVGNGIVGIGSFSSTSFSSFTASDFVSNFNQFDVTTAFTPSNIFGFQGSFELSTTGTAGTSPFVNEDIFVFVGNGSTFANSTEFLVVDTGVDFDAAADTSDEIVIEITRGNTTIAFGTPAANVPTVSPTDSTTTPGWQTAVPIPEPSVALLGGFGVLSLLRRRR